MKKYIKKTLKIMDLKLDKKNPRFESYTEKQKEDMFDLLFNELEKSMFALAKSIVEENSMNPFIRIGVVFENNEYIVVDGNRRIACLKFLLMNENQIKKIQNQNMFDFFYKNKDKILNFQKTVNENREIDVVLINNRDEAKEWLKKIHTNTDPASTKDWETFDRVLNAKKDHRYKIAKFINNKMHDLNIDRNDYVVNIKFTIWEKIFTSVNVLRPFFGIVFNENKEYELDSQYDFVQKFYVILKLIENKQINLQNFMNTKRQLELIKIIDLELKNKNQNYYRLKKAETIFKSNSKKKSNKIKFKFSIKLIQNIKYWKLKQILQQLNKIDHKKYKELILCSVRPIIEISIKFYLEKYNSIFNNDKKDNKKSLTKKILKVTNFILKNKQFNLNNENTLSFFWADYNKVNEFIKFLNADLHDEKLNTSLKELEEYLVKLNVLLEEIWKNIN